MKQYSPRFWESKSLDQLNEQEWEQLCDGCAKCCLHKLEDEDTGMIYYTNVVCRLLDTQQCRCRDYQRRSVLIKDCVQLTPRSLEFLQTMPTSCAYRLRAEGKPLPPWHHLVCGDKNTVHKEGRSVRGRTVDEEAVRDYEDHIVDWPLE